MTKKTTPLPRNAPKQRGTWEDHDGVVHVCFAWHSDMTNRELWSTICMVEDSLTTFVIDDWGYAAPTCVRCIVGDIFDTPDTMSHEILELL
jgi:hypothetical protein